METPISKDFVRYKLKSMIKYSKGGEFSESEFVEIRCPNFNTKKQVKYLRDLKSLVADVLMNQVDNFSSDKAKERIAEAQTEGEAENPNAILPAGMVLMLLLTQLKVNFSKAIDSFSENAEHFCFVGGEEALKGSALLEKIHPDDMDMIFATFIANFLMPSLMKSMSGNG